MSASDDIKAAIAIDRKARELERRAALDWVLEQIADCRERETDTSRWNVLDHLAERVKREMERQ